jgi:hypothetical protein
MVTADFELAPDDEIGQRAAMIEAFRLRGIYPDNVTSLAEDSLLWESYEPGELPPLPLDAKHGFLLREILKNAYAWSQPLGAEQKKFNEAEQREAVRMSKRTGKSAAPDGEESDLHGNIIAVMREYAGQNAVKLHLDPARPIAVLGFHPVFRVAPRGQLLVEMVMQFAQRDKAFEQDVERSGGLPLRGGTTVIAAANGDVRYVIAKPLESAGISDARNREARLRREQQEAFVASCDSRDARLAWSDDRYNSRRSALRMNFKAIHSEIPR